MMKATLFVWVVYLITTANTLTLRESNTGAGLTTMVKKTLAVALIASPYGRTIYIKPDYDPRLFPPVPRNSDAFKNTLKRRTTVERSFKRMFKDYDIEAGNCRSARERFSRATMAAVNMHLDAWIQHTSFSIITLIEEQAGQAV